MKISRLALLIASLLTAANAYAQGDGGSRSVFAIGAGNRAIGLGGAYGAIANDASAVLWNPAGLGLVPRRELQATTTSYYGLDIREHYASLVFPDYRWGAASLTLRYFGVSNIEQRDENNVLVSENLSDQQMEVVVGYGRKLNSLWSVGGSVKLQRQSTAGFSDGDVGVDIGVMTQPLELLGSTSSWAERLTVGLAARNVLEPRLRLNEDYVPDPTGIRLGFAFWAPFFENYPLLLAADIEKTQRTNTKLHAGFEFHVRSHLALRSGFNSRNFTAGASVGWQSISIDYAMENTNIDRLHRVGATFEFGQSVQEQEIAARARREQALREQVVERFDHAQKGRIRDLVTQARTANAGGDYDGALETLAIVEALVPNHPEAVALKAQCWRDRGNAFEQIGDNAEAVVSYSRALAIQPNNAESKEGLQRARLAGDRDAARTEAIRRHFAAGIDAFGRYDLVTARAEFTTVLTEDPADDDAILMYERTLRAIEELKITLIAECERAIDRRRFNEAELALSKIQKLDPGTEEIAALSSSLQAAKARRTDTVSTPSPTTAAVPARTMTRAQREEAERLYEQGMSAMAQGRLDEALRYWELVWSMNPSDARVVEHLKREYLQRGIVAFSEGELDDAVEMWEHVLRIDPNDKRASGYLRRAREQMARTRQILGE